MGKLTVVPTPIGNLGDITLRALDALRGADAVLAEDTRVSSKLFKHYEISTPLISHHQNNEHKTLRRLIDRLKIGSNMALISDAGTPAISDPGYLLVRECIREGIEVETLPGATAFVPALVNSGIPCNQFVFVGFLPPKKGRATMLGRIAEDDRTSVLYESPHRIVKTLQQLIDACGEDRYVSVSRELSKLHEETVRGSLAEVKAHFEAHPPKGEFVLVLSGKSK
ncbi:MAG: 16S rRNA (cytidine(1402)-2'-O)-methyltransferase [Flavobacteriales bacterium]|nr:16S rRNA (cytidine(1402)-2'-O)-methyltransferase [Flavobacteriales bacterium]